MTKENRFEGLMGVVSKNRRGRSSASPGFQIQGTDDKDAQTSKPQNNSNLKSKSQAEVHSAQSDVPKSSNKKKRSSADSAVSVESDCSKKSSSQSDAQSSKNLNISTSDKPNIQTSTTKVDNSISNVSASKHTDVPTVRNSDFESELTQHGAFRTSKKAKSANPDYTRTTVYLPKKMHKKLKAIALDEEREMSSIVEELIETWLSKRK
jgi:hypothetical protein